MDKEALYPGEERKMPISYAMYVYTHYFTFVWLVDVLMLVMVFLGVNQNALLAHVMAFMVIAGICVADRKMFSFEKWEMSWLDVVAIIFILLLGFYKCLYPDTSHDTMVYHVLSQDPEWSVWENSFYYFEISYPFADRIFYLFRYILGYRLGTMANAVILVLIFEQTKRLSQYTLADHEDGINILSYKRLITILSFGIVLLEGVLMDLGTYMTDLVAIPIVLELVYQIMAARHRENGLFDMCFFAINLSFIFECKLTNAIIVIALLVVYLLIVRKQLNMKKFFICFAAAVVIVFPYMLFTVSQAGVEYILGPYAGVVAAGGDMWGGDNFWQKLFTFVYLTKYPVWNKRMEIIDMPLYYPLVGIIISFCMFIHNKKNKFSTEIKIIVLITVLTFFIWSFVGGSERYKFYYLFLFGIIIIYAILASISERRKIIAIFLCAVIAVQSVGSLYCVLNNNNSWKWEPSVLELIAERNWTFTDQIKLLGRDRGEIIENGSIFEIFIAPGKPYSLWGNMINFDASIYQLFAMNESQLDDFYRNVCADRYIYAACKRTELQQCFSELDRYNMKVVGVFNCNNTYLGSMAVLQLQHYDEDEMKISNQLYRLDDVEDVELGTVACGHNYNISLVAEVAPFVTWATDAVEFEAYYIYEDERITICKEELWQQESYYLTGYIFLEDYPNDEEVTIYGHVSHNYAIGDKATQVYLPVIKEIE